MELKPPKDYLVRALMPGPVVRAASDSDGNSTLFGHFALFNEWTEIDSMWEGHFMERIAPGAFSKTFADKRDRIKVTFNHGHDPTMGDLALGSIRTLAEDSTGAAYEVDLLNSVPPMLREGLERGLYGSSFRFRVTREEFDREAEKSAYNPSGLPERTIKEVELYEFGPVTFPAYANATAGVRSMTDEDILERFSKGKGLKRFYDFVQSREHPHPEPGDEDPAPSEDAGIDPPPSERRDTPNTLPRHDEWMRARAKRERSVV